MERVDVGRNKRNIDQQSFESIEPFYLGELLSGIYPHEGPKGEKHKGNMKVTTILGNEMGFEGEAECTQPGCGVKVHVFAVSKSG